MFTGIITQQGTVTSIDKEDGHAMGLTIKIPDAQLISSTRIGDSIAVDGICLSVVTKNLEKKELSFQAIEQTRATTTIDTFALGSSVNIEGAMNMHDTLDGHVVSGHIDQTLTLLDKIKHTDKSIQLFIENKKPELIVLKGSIALNGVSLTISHVTQDYFCVSLIPITLQKTNLSLFQKGDMLNVEYDLLLKSQKKIKINRDALIGTRIISHEHAMHIALQLGEHGRVTAPPNPWVGCIIVKNNIIIGAGYHKKAGQPHAEIEALNSVQNICDAVGADLYVTLEPCCHTGKTPPCTQAIIKASIKNIYVALVDPDSRVQGRGIKILLKAGIATQTGIATTQAQELLKSYLFHRTTGKPYVIVKAATSIDGKIAASDGTSKWITDEAAREQVHRTRSQCQAILVGRGTVQKDNPQLTVRLEHYNGPQPMRIVLDTFGTLINKKLHIFNIHQAKTIMITSTKCNPTTKALWHALGIEYITVPIKNNGLCFEAIYKELGKRGILSVLVEGGAGIYTQVIQTGKFNELQLYIGNAIIGNNGINVFGTTLGNSMKEALRLKKVRQNNHCIIFEHQAHKNSLS